jgi:hypothetical protein
VAIGYLVAALLIQPFMLTAQHHTAIDSPYHFFTLRFRSSVASKRLIASLALLYQLLFTSLFLLASSCVLTTVLTFESFNITTVMWYSNVALGAVSILGTLLFKQSFTFAAQHRYVSLAQMACMMGGLCAAVVLTLLTSTADLNMMTLNNATTTNATTSTSNLWTWLSQHGDPTRLQLIRWHNAALTTRYTIWNQVFA